MFVNIHMIMVKLAFWDNCLSERGTTVAMYDYAYYNKPVIVMHIIMHIIICMLLVCIFCYAYDTMHVIIMHMIIMHSIMHIIRCML